MGKTSIEWTTRTWNPIAGCRRVSPGCGKGASPAGCYAENIAVRFAQSEGKAADRWRLVVRYGDCDKCDGTGAFNEKACPKCDGKKVVPMGWNGKFVEIPERLVDPLRWREPSTVFVNSTSDLFGEGVSDEYIAAVFGVMAATPRHTYQILTKRADRLAKWFEWAAKQMADEEMPWTFALRAACGHLPERIANQIEEDGIARDGVPALEPWPLPNVWIGVSVEDQQRADERIPHLLRVPAAVRFLSVEPMLGPVDLSRWIGRWECCSGCGAAYPVAEAVVDGDGVPLDECAKCGDEGQMISCWGEGQRDRWESGERYASEEATEADDGPALHWIIVGGESGPGARPFDLAWARSIVSQCKAAGVPAFVKQLGANARTDDDLADWRNQWPGGSMREVGGRLLLGSKKGGDPAEWPADLRVREWPEVAR